MKLSVTGVVEQRPSPTFFWIALFGILDFTCFIGLNMLFWQSQTGHVTWLLVKAVMHLVPPFIWLIGGIIVLFWLLLMQRLWRPPAVSMRQSS